MSFADLKEGDMLLKHVREVGGNFGRSWQQFRKWVADEYVEVVVEKATKVFYWVEGEKYRKEENGKVRGSWRSKPLFVLPVDQDGTPVKRYTTEELARIEELVEKIIRFLLTRRFDTGVAQKLASLENLESAAKFADRMYEAQLAMDAISAELDAAIKPAGE